MTIFIVGCHCGFFPYSIIQRYLSDGTGRSLLALRLVSCHCKGWKMRQPILSPVIILGVPIVDTVVCVRRKLSGRPAMEADKIRTSSPSSHGLHSVENVLVVYAIAILFSLIALLLEMFQSSRWHSLFLSSILGVEFLSKGLRFEALVEHLSSISHKIYRE